MKSTDETGGSNAAPILFDCGRLYIRLRCELFLAAFLNSRGHKLRATAIATKLERLARRLELTPEVREVLERLRETGAGFLRTYSLEWFDESVASLHSQVREEVAYPDYPYDEGEKSRRSTCDLHLASENDAMARLRDALVDGRDREGRSVFELGEWVEQAIHPRDVHRHFFEFVPIEGSSMCGYPGGYFFIVDRAPGEVPPPRGWLGRVRGMLRELGLLAGRPGILPPRLPESVKARRKAVGVITRAIRDRLAGSDGKGPADPGDPAGGGSPGPGIEIQVPAAYPGTEPTRAREADADPAIEAQGAAADPGIEPTRAREADADPAIEAQGAAADPGIEPNGAPGGPPVPAGGWTEPGHLGIKVHENERRLRRDGRPEVKLLRKRLWWNLVLAFLDAGERYLTPGEQLAVWREHGREDEISVKGRNTTFSKLNELLLPLGVKIDADSGDGRRRLIEISPK